MLVHAPSPDKGVKIDEESPLDPPWAYPQSKAETEELIESRHGGIKSVVLRFAGVYDEDCRAAFIAQQIARIFERLPTAYMFTATTWSMPWCGWWTAAPSCRTRRRC
jgi:nucleoside-diphosphate-sugar epimerase